MFFYLIYQALKWALYTQFYHLVAFCTSLYFKMIYKSLLSHSYKFRPYSTLKVIKQLFFCLLTTQLKICFSKPIRCQALLCYFPTKSSSEASKCCIQVLKCESDLSASLQVVSCQIQLFSHINSASHARWEQECCPNTMGKTVHFIISHYFFRHRTLSMSGW